MHFYICFLVTIQKFSRHDSRFLYGNKIYIFHICPSSSSSEILYSGDFVLASDTESEKVRVGSISATTANANVDLYQIFG